MNIHTVRTIVGILGNIFSVGLTVLSKWSRTQESLEELSIHDRRSFVGIVISSFWIYYTGPRVSPDHTLYMTMNAAVSVVLAVHIIILIWYAPEDGKASAALPKYLVVIIKIVVGLSLMIGRDVHKNVIRLAIAGSTLILFNYAFTLRYLPPLWVCLASIVDGCIWTIYSLLPSAELYITVVNGLNMVVGFIGVIMHWWWKPKISVETKRKAN